MGAVRSGVLIDCHHWTIAELKYILAQRVDGINIDSSEEGSSVHFITSELRDLYSNEAERQSLTCHAIA